MCGRDAGLDVAVAAAPDHEAQNHLSSGRARCLFARHADIYHQLLPIILRLVQHTQHKCRVWGAPVRFMLHTVCVCVCLYV